MFHMVKSARESAAIRINGDGSTLRDFVYVDDVCRAVKVALDRRTGGLFNLACGVSLSVRRIAEIIAEGLRSGVEIVHQPEAPGAKRAGSLVFDVSRFRKGFPGFEFTSLVDGVRLYLEAMVVQSGGVEQV